MSLLDTTWDGPTQAKKWFNAGRKKENVEPSLREFAEQEEEVRETILTSLQDIRNTLRALCAEKDLTLEEYQAEASHIIERINDAYKAVRKDFPEIKDSLNRVARYIMETSSYGVAGVRSGKVTDEDLEVLMKDTVTVEGDEEPFAIASDSADETIFLEDNGESSVNLESGHSPEVLEDVTQKLQGIIGDIEENGKPFVVASDDADEATIVDTGSSVDAAADALAIRTNPDSEQAKEKQRKQAAKELEKRLQQKEKDETTKPKEKKSKWKLPKIFKGRK